MLTPCNKHINNLRKAHHSRDTELELEEIRVDYTTLSNVSNLNVAHHP